MGKFKNSGNNYRRVSVQSLKESKKVMHLIATDLQKRRQSILATAAKPMVQAAKTTAPRSKKPHNRYAGKKGKRSAKGEGQIVATYHPGNLSRAVKVMRFRKAKSKVFVGVNLPKNAQGVFKGRKTDGYYLHMVAEGTKYHGGNPYWQNAYESTKGVVQQNIIEAFKSKIKEYDNAT